MKKCLCLILSLIMLLLIAGCDTPAADTPAQPTDETSTQPTEDAPVLPPQRIYGYASGDLGMKYTFSIAIEKAEVIARVRIGDWLGEDTDRFSTYYEAEVLQCFRGDIPDTFVLKQPGCSIATFETDPLYTYGNEFLVFLGVGDENNALGYTPIYYTIGVHSTMLAVSYDESGNCYYTDWLGWMGESMDISTNYAENQEIYTQVLARAREDDPVRARPLRYIFAEQDVISLLNDL
ncbi:MAG: hypothetical protein IJB47_04445 [Oscillospiraceae bacterium]|nr:hypothetical protein [Oscillospiraceae bacterium]